MNAKFEPPLRTVEQYEADKVAGINTAHLGKPIMRIDDGKVTTGADNIRACPKRKCPYVAGYNCIKRKCAVKPLTPEEV